MSAAPAAAEPAVIEHGTYGGSQKCRPPCEPCKRAKREYMAGYRQR